MIDLKKFKEIPPYATELFGVYQPLLGWKGNLAKNRIVAERDRYLNHVVSMMKNDSRFRDSMTKPSLLAPLVALLPIFLIGWALVLETILKPL